mgnify:CR=1 FL=1
MSYHSGFEFDKDKNLCEINDVFINFDKNKEPKIKTVHFKNEDKISPNDKNKANNVKKSNLKKNKKESNVSLINSIDLNNSNIIEHASRTIDSSSPKVKTESSIRNKSNGI